MTWQIIALVLSHVTVAYVALRHGYVRAVRERDAMWTGWLKPWFKRNEDCIRDLAAIATEDDESMRARNVSLLAKNRHQRRGLEMLGRKYKAAKDRAWRPDDPLSQLTHMMAAMLSFDEKRKRGWR